MERGGVALAILDLRLLNDLDERDSSGLGLALTVAPEIPKLLLSNYATFETAREALGPKLDGLPPATDFLKKGNKQELLTAVRKALNISSRYRQVSRELAHKLDENYLDACRQAIWNYRTGWSIALIGAVIIFAGVFLAFRHTMSVAVISTLAGVIMEVAGVLFFRRIDSANARRDRYHQELLETRRLENLLEACGELLVPDAQERCKEQAIVAAINLWLGPRHTQPGPLAELSAQLTKADNKE